MASAIRSQALTDELVQLITGYDPIRDANRVRGCKEHCTRVLRHQRHARTNPFAVQVQLDGVVERLYVGNKDDVAEALSGRLAELNALHDFKSRPDILALLVGLSEAVRDEDAGKRLETVTRIRDGEIKTDVGVAAGATKGLTWEEIMGDDQTQEDKQWGLIEDKDGNDSDWYSDGEARDRDYDSSASDSIDAATDATNVSMTTEHLHLNITAESLILEDDPRPLMAVKEAQNWRVQAVPAGHAKPAFAVPISELDAAREILHMLQGLPTNLFLLQPSTGYLMPSDSYYIQTLSTTGFIDLLETFAAVGRDLERLRSYVRRANSLDSSTPPTRQTFTECVEERLVTFSKTVTGLGQLLSRPRGPTPVSLFELQAGIEAAWREAHLRIVLDIVDDPACEQTPQLLQHLYEAVLDAQLIADEDQFRTMAGIFHSCLATYMRPIERWMASGELDTKHAHQDEVFVERRHGSVDLANFWSQQYTLRSNDGLPAAPACLHEHVETMFARGKEAAFLAALGVRRGSDDGSDNEQEENDNTLIRLLDLASEDAMTSMVPYSSLFSRAIRTWLAARQTQASSILRDHLLHQGGLLKTLDALAHLYLSADGSVFQIFADGVFARLDVGKPSWADPLAIETVLKDAYIHTASIENQSLGVQAARRRDQRLTTQSAADFSVKALNALRTTLKLSSGLQNIILPSQMATYQAAHVFLLQLYRTTSSLANIDVTKVPHRTLSLSLRQRLLHLVNTIQSHTLHAGIAAGYIRLQHDMLEARSVDEMIAAHAKFSASLDRCCFRQSEMDSIRRAVLGLCDIAVTFAREAGPGHGIRADKTSAVVDDSPSEEDEDVEIAMKPQGGRKAGEKMTPARLRQMLNQVGHLQNLIIAGLRSASRAEADAHDTGTGTAETGIAGTLAEELASSCMIEGVRH